MRPLLALALPCLLLACATTQEDPDVVKMTVEREVQDHKSSGEPIYSTSVAIYLAELALKREGVDFKDRNMAVSFCDGVYTVTFEKPHDRPLTCDYTVAINANNSEIIDVVTEK